MADRDVLSQDEMEALAEGVSSGDVVVDGDVQHNGEVKLYDFHQPAHILRTKLTALDLINERFAKEYEAVLFGFLHKAVEVTPLQVEMVSFSDYINGLEPQASINRVKSNHLNGLMLFSFHVELVFMMVDSFFGGLGKLEEIDKEREFTSTENRIIEKAVNLSFEGLESVWSPITKFGFEYLQAENRNQISNFADKNEVFMISKFKLELDSVVGEFHMAMPYSMIEAFRPLLASGAQKEKTESNDEWVGKLKHQIRRVSIEVKSIFAETDITLKELLDLKPGDFIPINMQENTSAFIGDLPVFEGKVGVSNNAAAVRLTKWNDDRQI